MIKNILHITQSIAKQYQQEFYTPLHLLRALLHPDSNLQEIIKEKGKNIRQLEEWCDIRLEHEPRLNRPHEPLAHESINWVTEQAALISAIRPENSENLSLLEACISPGGFFSARVLDTFPVKFHELVQGSSEKISSKKNVSSKALETTEKYMFKTVLNDSFYGREQELKEIQEVLLLHQKPHVLISGDQGIGKTSLINQLIQEMDEPSNEPHFSIDEVRWLNLAKLNAGASYKGESEDRLDQVLKTVSEFSNGLLVIDDFQDFCKAEEGRLLALMAVYLARRAFTLCAIISTENYRLYIESDERINRYVQHIPIKEASSVEVIEMLKVRAISLEEFHKIQVSQDCISKAVELSEKYIRESFLPESAIQLIDRSLASVRKQRNDIIDNEGDYELNSVELSINDLYNTIAKTCGIPVGNLDQDERSKLKQLESRLNERVKGQDSALSTIANAIRRSRSGLGEPNQPVGSFFLAGPTGTGKTELAKTLAKLLFGDEKFLIRFDMSEFKEEHSSALLNGAPPGYVGYEQGGLLVNKIRLQPYSVLLFDEVEKAHLSVYDLFLQILDDGRLTDRLGKTGDFTNCIVLFTSNLGSNRLFEDGHNNQIPNSEEMKLRLSDYFRDEFLGRMDEIIPFRPLGEEIAKQIIEIQLTNFSLRAKNQGVNLIISDAVKQHLLDKGYNKKFGARPLKDAIRNSLATPLSSFLIEHVGLTGKLLIDFRNNSCVFSLEKEIINEKIKI